MTSFLVLMSALLAFVSCVLLALSQRANMAKVIPAEKRVIPKFIHRAGWVIMGLSLGLCVFAEGLSFGILLWPLLFAVAAFSVALELAYRPAMFRPFALVVTYPSPARLSATEYGND